MIELKSYKMVDEKYCTDCVCVIPSKVYLKSEADNVIADLEDKLRAANEQIENLINSASSIMLFQDRVIDNKYDELRHNKYKRCLANANYWVAISYHCVDDKHRKKAEKRHYKWLELAEKFKEAK